MDIFKFAMEKERYAEYYYRDLAERTSNPGLRSILTMLAGEEAKHYEVVKQMKARTPVRLTDTPVLANAAKIFAKMREAADKFDFDVSEADLYHKACDIEKESKKYYLQKAEEVGDAGQKDIFKKLAEEENKHLLLVERIGDFVARPETFLENAEMYHFDDYVEGQF
ncbi:MAG: ferritin family protein [Sedimentisphaerales bacterium]|nr:ferritin family protein [Sedimentisphaerales bacterium]